MTSITLHNTSPRGERLEATYLPEQGMNLVSYKAGGKEMIDQNSRSLFEERKAGLGALIGPHFHQKENPNLSFDFSLFPHVAPALAQGRKDPFSHGIARYVPWNYTHSETQIKASLSSKSLYKGVALSQLEENDFEMIYETRLLSTGLFISYRIHSSVPSVLGLHYYYSLPDNGIIKGDVEPIYRDGEEWKPIPSQWMAKEGNQLQLTLDSALDYGFIPKKKAETDHEYQIILEGSEYALHIDFVTASNSEISWQLYRPQNSSYICIEPLSARYPIKPILTSSALEVKIGVFFL